MKRVLAGAGAANDPECLEVVAAGRRKVCGVDNDPEREARIAAMVEILRQYESGERKVKPVLYTRVTRPDGSLEDLDYVMKHRLYTVLD